jgi:hypothetical protein
MERSAVEFESVRSMRGEDAAGGVLRVVFPMGPELATLYDRLGRTDETLVILITAEYGFLYVYSIYSLPYRAHHSKVKC